MHPKQAGLSLVELMIGLALGLFVTVVMLTLVTGQLRENRNLRRAGYWAAAERGIGSPSGSTPRINPYTETTPSTGALTFRFSRDAVENHQVDDDDQFGFRLHDAALQMQLGAGNWQSLTDATALVVTRFSLTPQDAELPLGQFCAKPCPAATAGCPKQQIRRIVVDIAARASGDALVERSVRSEVRLRNDVIVGACPA
jgi:type IV pilus assembly protein PilW